MCRKSIDDTENAVHVFCGVWSLRRAGWRVDHVVHEAMRAVGGVPVMSGSAIRERLQVRYADGVVRTVPLPDVGAGVFEGAVPWRVFRWYRGQQHFAGSYWSSTMQAPVGYESRLELAWLLLADADPAVSRIVSQPFLLEADVDGRTRRHVPDYLFVADDGSCRVIDVKPSERLAVPAVAEALAWSRSRVEAVGWEYRVCAEPDPVRWVNARFLAGYRRSWQFDPGYVAAIVDVVRRGVMTFGEAERAATAAVGSATAARAVLLHLLWVGTVRTDLSRLLGAGSVLEAGAGEVGR